MSTEAKTGTQCIRPEPIRDLCLADARHEIVLDIIHHLRWIESQKAGASLDSIKQINESLNAFMTDLRASIR